MNKLFLSFLIVIYMQVYQLDAQEIPVGSWRSHLSYRQVADIAFAGGRVYAMTSDGNLFYVETDDGTVEGLSSVKGLRRASVTSIAALDNERIMVGYDGGEIDVISGTSIIQIDDIVRSAYFNEDKYINRIMAAGEAVYVCTGFGVVVFDPSQLIVEATYSQLGDTGDQLLVYDAEIWQGNLVLATESGTMSGNLTANLQDPDGWTRYFGSGITEHLALEGSALYAGMEGLGLYSFTGSDWILVDGQLTQFSNIKSGAGLLACGGEECYELINGTLQVLNFTLQGVPAVCAGNPSLWVGTDQGLFLTGGNTAEKFLPEGPYSNLSWSLDYSGDRIIGTSGGYDSSFDPWEQEGSVYLYANGMWSSINSELVQGLASFPDPVMSVYDPIEEYWLIASYGGGLYSLDDTGNVEIFTIPGSAGTIVNGLYRDADGVWMTTKDGVPSLYNYKNGTWSSLPVGGSPYYARDISSDRNHLYILKDPAFEGHIEMVDKQTGSSRYLSTIRDQGDLPGPPTCMTVDRKGEFWVGTTNGVAFITRANMDGPINAFTPINEFTPLLRGRRINSIAVDGGNRKWISTDAGVWLVSETGEDVILQFNIANSPLLSDEVDDIAVNNQTGEVFFSTGRGVISYRANATEPSISSAGAEIFPNPVLPGFTGFVSVRGLKEDVEVKFTDSSGRLVYETRSNGGMASWNLVQFNGEKPGTGVYFVFVSDRNGEDTFIGKLAVIR